MLLICLYVLYFELYDFWILPLRPLRIFWSVFWCVSCIFWRVDFSFVNVAWQIVMLCGMLIDWPAAKKKFYRKQNVSGRYWTVEGRYCWLSCHKLMQCMSLWRECESSRFRSRSDSGKIRQECTTIFFNSPKTRNFKSNSSGQRSPTSQNKIQRTDQERRVGNAWPQLGGLRTAHRWWNTHRWSCLDEVFKCCLFWGIHLQKSGSFNSSAWLNMSWQDRTVHPHNGNRSKTKPWNCFIDHTTENNPVLTLWRFSPLVSTDLIQKWKIATWLILPVAYACLKD